MPDILVGHTRWKQLLFRLLNQCSFNIYFQFPLPSIFTSLFHADTPMHRSASHESHSPALKEDSWNNVAKNTLNFMEISPPLSQCIHKALKNCFSLILYPQSLEENGIPSHDVSTKLWKNCISHNVSTAHCKKTTTPSRCIHKAPENCFSLILYPQSSEKPAPLTQCTH